MTYALVTGGAQRLGASICKALADAGYDILIHYRSSAHEANELAADCRKHGVEAKTIYGNFASRDGVEDFIENFQRGGFDLGAIVHNVGNYHRSPLATTDLDTWYELFQINVHAVFAITTALLPYFNREGGAIVNIGVAGIEQRFADKYTAAYTMTKGVLLMMTKSFAIELASKNISVNMVSPGWLDNSVHMPKSLDLIPMGRLGTTTEIARQVLELIDSKNRYITGQNLEVAGGVRL